MIGITELTSHCVAVAIEPIGELEEVLIAPWMAVIEACLTHSGVALKSACLALVPLLRYEGLFVSDESADTFLKGRRLYNFLFFLLRFVIILFLFRLFFRFFLLFFFQLLLLILLFLLLNFVL